MTGTTADARAGEQSRIPLSYAFIALTGVLLIFLGEYLGFFQGINNHTYDLFLRLRGTRGHSPQILIAAIDEKTLDKLGKWPLPRSTYARLLDRVALARLAVFDVLMVEPSPEDEELAAGMKRFGKAVLPAYIESQSKDVIYPRPFPVLAIGHVHLEEEIDGVVRRVFHTLHVRDTHVPSVTSAAWEVHQGTSMAREGVSPESRAALSRGSIVQLDPMKVNFYGGPQTFPHVSLVDIVEGRLPAEFFRDKIVMVGMTATGIEAQMLTPFTEQRRRTAGVEIHANILNNLLDRTFITDVPEWAELLVCVVIGALLFALLLKMGEKRATMLWLGTLVLVTVAVFLLLNFLYLWVNPASLWCSVTLVFLVTYVCRLDQAARRLDQGYAAIVSMPGWERPEEGEAADRGGLMSHLSAGGINAKVRLVSEITEELRHAYIRISKDLESAAAMQRTLLPSSAASMAGVNFEWLFYPSRFVAGDIFNYFQIDDAHVAFYLADVSGHGVPAAMFSVTISKILSPAEPRRSHLFHFDPHTGEHRVAPPAVVLRDVNTFFAASTTSDQYVTMIYGIMDTEARRLSLAQAGLPPPILVRAGGEVSLVGSGGFPVGLMEGVDYTDEVVPCGTGDRIYFYSDGIPECFNGSGEQFSTDRLITTLEKARTGTLADSLRAVEEALLDWRGNMDFDDDVTMLALEIE